jgi:hypothetical protein
LEGVLDSGKWFCSPECAVQGRPTSAAISQAASSEINIKEVEPPSDEKYSRLPNQAPEPKFDDYEENEQLDDDFEL